MFRLVMTTLRIVRGTVTTIWLLGSLAFTSVGLAVWAASLSFQLAAVMAESVVLTAQLAKARIEIVNQRKKSAKAVAKTKAKGRLRRYIVAVPIAGTVAAVAFEEFEYQSWLEEHPDRGRVEYGCDVWETTVEVSDEVLQELPERVRPSSDLLLRWLPRCETASQ